jgi:hypothetical protein
MKDNIVWIVSSGEQGEGGSVEGVYSDRDAAIAAALKLPTIFGPWKADFDGFSSPPPWQWISGCDYAIVERWKVE